MIIKRFENVDKTFWKCWQNVLKMLTNVLKTLTKRSENVDKTLTKRSENVDKTFTKRSETLTKHSENIDKSVLCVTAFIRTWKDGRDTGFAPCVHASWTVYFNLFAFQLKHLKMTVSQHASCKNGHLFYFLEKKMKEKIQNLINKEPIAKS
jgi:hypothetical protein